MSLSSKGRAASRPAASTAPDTLTFGDVVWVFAICSLAGLVVETLVSYPIDGVWKNRAGFLWGPLSPIYGVGGVLLSVFLWPFRRAHWGVVYVVSAVVGAAFEYVAGWFWETYFGIVAWSYIDQPFNINGYTCLGIALVWGVAGLAWVKLALPVVLRFTHAFPRIVKRQGTCVLLAFLLADAAATVTALDCWFLRQSGQQPTGAVQEFFAENYGDDFMADRFQTMSMYTVLADRSS